MNGFLVVFLGGGVGAAARHGVNLLAAQGSAKFPWGTLAVNVLGSLLIGVLAEWFALRAQLPQPLRLFLITGVLGGFTTFSAFSLEVGLLIERGQMAAAAGYVLASIIGAVGAMFVGMYLVRHIAA
ncbi:MAG: fluoride efflux transporter CrcB [Steroidobacteraceae bacterium]